MTAEDELHDMDSKYHEKKGRKWIVMILGTLILGVLGFILMPWIYRSTHSFYDRRGIESIADEKFGTTALITSALTEEVLIVSYDYNAHKPRLFSKYYANRTPELYNVTFADASEASSAAPIYFDPKVIGQ